MWRLGRWLLLADIALRRSGFGEPIDTTIQLLEGAMSDLENQRLYRLFMSTLTEWTEQGESIDTLPDEISRRAGSDDDYRRMVDAPSAVLNAILELWGSQIDKLIALLTAEMAHLDSASKV